MTSFRVNSSALARALKTASAIVPRDVTPQGHRGHLLTIAKSGSFVHSVNAEMRLAVRFATEEIISEGRLIIDAQQARAYQYMEGRVVTITVEHDEGQNIIRETTPDGLRAEQVAIDPRRIAEWTVHVATGATVRAGVLRHALGLAVPFACEQPDRYAVIQAVGDGTVVATNGKAAIIVRSTALGGATYAIPVSAVRALRAFLGASGDTVSVGADGDHAVATFENGDAFGWTRAKAPALRVREYARSSEVASFQVQAEDLRRAVGYLHARHETGAVVTVEGEALLFRAPKSSTRLPVSKCVGSPSPGRVVVAIDLFRNLVRRIRTDRVDLGIAPVGGRRPGAILRLTESYDIDDFGRVVVAAEPSKRTRKAPLSVVDLTVSRATFVGYSASASACRSPRALEHPNPQAHQAPEEIDIRVAEDPDLRA